MKSEMPLEVQTAWRGLHRVLVFSRPQTHKAIKMFSFSMNSSGHPSYLIVSTYLRLDFGKCPLLNRSYSSRAPPRTLRHIFESRALPPIRGCGDVAPDLDFLEALNLPQQEPRPPHRSHAAILAPLPKCFFRHRHAPVFAVLRSLRRY